MQRAGAIELVIWRLCCDVAQTVRLRPPNSRRSGDRHKSTRSRGCKRRSNNPSLRRPDFPGGAEAKLRQQISLCVGSAIRYAVQIEGFAHSGAARRFFEIDPRLCLWSIRRDMPRSTLAKPSASSAAWSARSTSLLLTCRTRTPASWSAIPPNTEAFCDGHVRAFSFFGGVPQSILYDNTKIAVARILGDGKRQRTRGFAELQSHYLFRDRFGRPGKGNDKGKVEGLVGYARRNFLVPLPVFESFEALNAYLVECCRRRMADRLRGHNETIAQRLERDLAAFQRPLPPPYDACEKVATRVSSLSLVRYRLNDYSVPTTYGHRDVLVRGYVDDVVISCGAEVIARHPRSYERHDFIFDPLHYLALIEQKINALDQAAPLAGWRLPEEFMTLRRLLEARMGKQGKREFVQVLRLMEVFPLDDVAAAARDAIARGAIGFDAVKHLILCHIERRPPRLDMTVYPYLPRAQVTMTSASTYMSLLTGASS